MERHKFLNNFHSFVWKDGSNKGLKIKRAKSCASDDGSSLELFKIFLFLKFNRVFKKNLRGKYVHF